MIKITFFETTKNPVEIYREEIRCRGKSYSEELILVSTNPQYDKRCLEHVVYINCSKCKNKDLPLHRKGTAGLKIYVYYILNHTLITCFATNLVDKKLSEGQSKVFSH